MTGVVRPRSILAVVAVLSIIGTSCGISASGGGRALPSGDEVIASERAVPWDVGRRLAGRGGDTIVVVFVGAPGSQAEDRWCGIDYVAVAEESASEVVVTVRQVAAPSTEPNEARGCTSLGHLRTAVVALGTPVGDRSVVDGATGAPHSLEG